MSARETPPGDHWTTDLALDVAHGLLGTDAEAAALAHAEGCPGCERMFRRAVRDREKGRILRQRAIRRESPARGAAEVVPLRARFGARRGRWTAGLVAAAAAIAVAVFGPWRPGTSLEWLPAQGEDMRLRGGLETPGADRLARGLQAYAAHDARSAIAALEGFEMTGSLEHVRRLYLGSALVHAGRPRDAIGVLETLPETGIPEPWGDEARWALFVALRATHEDARAREVARRLAAEPSAAGARARTWLEKHGGSEAQP